MALPRLTWIQGDIFYTGEDDFSATITPSKVLDTLKNAINTSTYWSVTKEDTGILELSPKSGIISDSERGIDLGFRMLLVAGPTLNSAWSGAGLSEDDKNSRTFTSGINVSDRLSFGIAPNGGTFLTDNLADLNPYGSAKWSKWYSNVDIDNTMMLYLIESEEILAIVYRAGSAVGSTAYDGTDRNRWKMMIVGAIFEPASGSNNSEVDGRIYGAISDSNIPLIFWRDTHIQSAQFFDERDGPDFPTVPAGIFRPRTNFYDAVNEYFHDVGITNSTSFRPRGDDQCLVMIPQFYRSYISPSSGDGVFGEEDQPIPYYVGQLRQMFIGPRAYNRDIYLDSDGNEAVIFFNSEGGSGGNYKNGHSLVFCN